MSARVTFDDPALVAHAGLAPLTGRAEPAGLHQLIAELVRLARVRLATEGRIMADENLSVPPRAGDLDPEDVTVEAELVDKDAEREIGKAVRGRRGIARKYVKWVRRRNPGATPAEIIRMLEHHYVTAISVAGAAITTGSIAGEVGIALIPVVGPAATGTKAVAKEAGKKAAKEAVKTAAKETTKAAAKSAALGAARSGAQRAAARLPAGDEQLQFQITATFGLAVADIHGMDLDQEQAHALVYALSNGRVSQKQIATMASDLAQSLNPEIVSVGQTSTGGRKDLAHWTNTLADSLPRHGGHAPQRWSRTAGDCRFHRPLAQQTAPGPGLVSGNWSLQTGCEWIAVIRSGAGDHGPAGRELAVGECGLA